MVSTTIAEKTALADGKYRLVGWDVDSTGQLVTDEICQLAAFTAKDSFSQYIMPYKDLTKTAQRRYMVCTCTVGRFRALTDKKTGQIIRSKSEIYGLVDFLSWLEKIKNQEPTCSGIILLCHDAYEMAPLLLIQALKRYNLLDRFSSIVKGFANCYAFAKLKCESSVTSFSLKTLSKILLDQENEQTYSAKNRARLAYQLVNHLRAGMVYNVDSTAAAGASGDASTVLSVELGDLCKFISTLADKQKAIDSKIDQLKQQKTLNPVFLPLMRQGINDRKRAFLLRNQLIDAKIDYQTLRNAWTEGNSEKVSSLLGKLLSESDEKDRQEIVEMVVSHFEDPPVAKGSKGGARRGSSKSMSETTSGPQSPTSSSSPSNGPGLRHNGHRINGSNTPHTPVPSSINSTTSE